MNEFEGPSPKTDIQTFLASMKKRLDDTPYRFRGIRVLFWRSTFLWSLVYVTQILQNPCKKFINRKISSHFPSPCIAHSNIFKTPICGVYICMRVNTGAEGKKNYRKTFGQIRSPWHRLPGLYDNSMPESTLSSHSGTKNSATVEVQKSENKQLISGKLNRSRHYLRTNWNSL